MKRRAKKRARRKTCRACAQKLRRLVETRDELRRTRASLSSALDSLIHATVFISKSGLMRHYVRSLKCPPSF